MRAARASDTGRAAADAARLPLLLDACAGHDRVACYASVPPEPDTWAFIDALEDAGVQVLLPKLAGHRTPVWRWHTGRAGLVDGWRGIPEPAGDALGADALASCSFVWCSALAVTGEGTRLGVGGGWYDRALPHASPGAVIGTLANDAELVDAVPSDPWDVPVDLVVTPTRIVRVGAGRAR